MTKIIQTTIMAIAIVLFPLLAWTQTAALLPNASQQFFDGNGNPLSAGTVTTYIVGTSTLKTTWRDSAETIPNTNPIILDAAGRAIIYGDGNYRQVLRDRNGNLIWDAPTSAFGSGGATLFGDGTGVGTVLQWSGLVAPVHYAFAYGQELSRVTYVQLFNAITLSTSINCTSGSAVLSGISDTTQIPIGAKIEATCVAAGSTVVSKTASSVNASVNASVTTSITAIFFPYGNGNGTSTFNVPDFRGRVLAGRDNMGGTAASRLTQNYFAIAGTGATGGSENRVLITQNFPAYTPAGGVTFSTSGTNIYTPGGTIINQSNFVTQTATAGGINVYGVGSNSLNFAFSGTASTTTFTGIAQGGNSTPFSIVQPTMTLNYIIKITPDTNISTLNVVTSIQSMTGDITCGANLTCVGNVISATGGGGGSGDVTGPASAVNNNIVTFDGITGKIIKDSGISIASVGNGITDLSGDGSASGPGSATLTLSTVNSNIGAFGSSTSIPNFTVDGKGRVLATGSNVVVAPAGTLTGTTLNSTVVTSSLTSVGTIVTGVWNGTTIAVANGGTGLTSGTSGGVPTYTASGALTSSGALTLNNPVLGGGAGAVVTSGTRAGNTTVFATTTGTMTAGDCVSIDGSGNLIAAGGACTTGGGGGTVTSSTAGQIAYYATTSTTVVGNANINVSAGAVTLGQAGSIIGQLKLAGNTSGTITITPQAAAGTYNFNLPTAAGTAGQALLSGGGGAAAHIYGTLGVAAGGTGLTSGTSGGILAFTASGTLASSGALTANLPVIGGGAGVAPTVGTRSGNTTAFATVTGTLTSGRCVQIDASGNFVQAAAACSAGGGTVTSIVAGTGLTGGTITTTGTIALDLTSANIWSGNQTFSGAMYAKNGYPWADIVGYGAIGNGSTANSTANTNAFDNAVTTIAAIGGGDVFIPPGTYCVKPSSGSFALNYTGINNLRLICAGPQGACAINACAGDGTTFTVIRLNGQKNALVNMTVNGADPAAGVAPTGDGVLFDTGCTECYAENSKFLRGRHAVVASAADIWFKDVNMDSSYGSSLLNVNGAVHMVRGKLDQAWPTTEWSVGATISAWAASTVYATNAFVSRLGFIFQATTGGTSAGSGGPIVTTYGTAITDNTVVWKLVAPSTYAALEFTGGGASSFVDVDMTGPYFNGVAFTSGSPQLVEFSMLTFGGPRNACIYLNSGSQVSVTQSKITRCGIGVQTDTGWTSELQITTSRIYQNAANGIQLAKPSLANINSNTFSGNGNWAIDVAGQANMYANFNSNLFISNGSGAVEITGSGSTQCNIGLNSSNGQTYTLGGCTGTANN